MKENQKNYVSVSKGSVVRIGLNIIPCRPGNNAKTLYESLLR